MTELNIFPWQDKTKKPFFVNPEGFEWWIDQNLTDWCKRENPLNPMPILNAVCFYVVKDNKPLERILIDAKNNSILGAEKSLEAMAAKIDMYRMVSQ